MEWLFHILFLTSCGSLVSLPVNGEGPNCEIMNKSLVLNMERNSAAYYFSRSETSDDLAIKFLRAELNNTYKFEKIWEQATNRWRNKKLTVPDGLREENVIAMTAYTIGGDLYRTLNDEVRSYGGDLNTYNACFKLKSFHYLLSVALQVLRNSSIGPVYRGTKGQISGTLGTEMRFGIFTSTSHSKKVAEEFGTDTVFDISPSYGVDLRTFSVNPWQEEVLIPPYEKFKIAESSGGNRYTLDSRGYDGVEVWLGLDGSGSLIVYSITPWGVWFLIALVILLILGGGAGLAWYFRNKFS